MWDVDFMTISVGFALKWRRAAGHSTCWEYPGFPYSTCWHSRNKGTDSVEKPTGGDHGPRGHEGDPT